MHGRAKSRGAAVGFRSTEGAWNTIQVRWRSMGISNHSYRYQSVAKEELRIGEKRQLVYFFEFVSKNAKDKKHA